MKAKDCAEIEEDDTDDVLDENALSNESQCKKGETDFYFTLIISHKIKEDCPA